ncbi:DUF1593-domain-containing protein [Aspergillus steynii IBT 23096]|uniref:DUF1593-domain-containing protein n=1 Tax=Aspergillus steynii IBT 23096 TaxID=1392250 RepID=A0A2I2FZW4_9EURO|nr:DUF1593-domain-containing protein [Aspergillus steynii IBT 23096]PLB46169.1 DUF1593-domain-containing protein [Aspergillus steynii IBT 23096]
MTRSQVDNRIPDLTRLALPPSKPRVFLLTDIENEPDDQESLVRYLLYSNEFETRGICAVTSAWLPTRTAPESIRTTIKAYALVVDNLNQHVHPDARYPTAEALLKLVSSGAPVYGKQALSLPLSPGARDLVNKVQESTEPLWVLSWGGTNVLAETLQHIHETKTPAEEAVLHSRLRVYTISDQDDTGEWIRNAFPAVFFICSIHGFGAFDMSTWQGISHPISGGDLSKVSAEWLRAHIQKGPLGKVYPTPMHIMEGDTPTFLYLIQNGLGHPERPDFGSWGGRYRAVNVGSAHYADVVDTLVGPNKTERTDQKATICRWRDHFQNDFVTRMSWSVTSHFWQASHPPVPIVDGHQGPACMTRKVKSGDIVVLDASKTYDPDHPEDNSHLEFQWYQYLEPTLSHPIGAQAVPRCTIKPLSPPPGTSRRLVYNDAGFEDVALGPCVEVVVPDSKKPAMFGMPVQHWLPYTGVDGMFYHIILQVSHRKAQFPVHRYLRIILDAGLS